MNKQEKIRVMVVDDHFVVRVGLAGTINVEHDLEVVAEAKDGVQALEMFRRHQPDVTLMDLRLPGMGGDEATAAIRREFPKARIIVLSTYDGDDNIHRALQAGAQGYLLKTALHNELLKAIRAVHAGRKYLPAELASQLATRAETEDLSPREIEVLRQIAQGRSNKEIAAALFISEATVKSHVIHILGKLGVNDRTLAVTSAVQRGIIVLE